MLFQRVFGQLLHSPRTLSALKAAPYASQPLSARFILQKSALSASPIRAALPHKPFAWPRPGPRSFFTSSKQPLRYHSPQPRFQWGNSYFGFLDKIPQNVIFYGILGANTVVFGMWYLSWRMAQDEKDFMALRWMRDNFTNSWRNLSSGRIWTILTCCFSHEDLSHILMNTFTFYFMAQPVLQYLGGRKFMFLYLGGGLACSALSIAYGLLMNHRDHSAHGASGAIYSVVTLLACTAPTMTFNLYGIIPIPAWLVVTGLFVYDGYRTVTDNRGKTDTAGHIGGILFGVGYFIAHRFRRL